VIDKTDREANLEADLEDRLAVLTNWSFWGSFGLCFLLSGFVQSQYFVGLLGFGLFGAGFVCHLIINRVFATTFRDGEVTTAIGVFGVGVLGFILVWIADPALARPRVWLGLTGTAIAVGGLFAYLSTRFGLKNSFSMFHMKNRF
jgi:hypothetical protein